MNFYSKLCFIFCGLFFFAVQNIIPQESPLLVKKIEFIGLEIYSEFEISSKMQTKEGDLYSENRFKEDIKRLFQTGFFEEISWEKKMSKEGIIISIRFKERKAIKEIKFLYNDFLSDKNLREIIKQKSGDVYSEMLTMQDISAIKEKYLSSGFYFVEVKSEIEKARDGLIVKYIVAEGPRVKVRKIYFEGNHSISAKELRKYMATKESSWLGSNYLKKSVLLTDIEQLKSFYRSQGFLNVVLVYDINFSELGDLADIHIAVEENERFTIEKVELKGVSEALINEVTSKIKVKAGEVYSGEKIQNDVRIIRDLYEKKGFPNVYININTYLSDKPGSVILSYEISEGERFYVGRVDIFGNYKTRDKVIRRELTIYPGELYSTQEAKESLRRLQNLNYFETINIETVETLNKEVKDVKVTVKEKATGYMSFGAGYGSTVGLVGMFEFVQPNFDITRFPSSFRDIVDGIAFSGAGQTFRLRAMPAAKQSSFEAYFKEPYFLDKPMSLEVLLSDFIRDWSNYRESDFQARIGGAYRLKNKWYLGSSLGYERIKISEVKVTAPDEIKSLAGRNVVTTITPYIGKDTTNHPIFPTDGYKIHLSTEVASKVFGGDFDYLKAMMSVAKYFSVYTTRTEAEHILSVRSSLGIIRSYGGSEIPFFEKFFAGGPNSVRGFRYRTISPKVNGDEVGGKNIFVTQIEYSFPVYRSQVSGLYSDIIRFLFFTDIGTSNDENVIFKDIRISTGFGLKVTVPQLGNVPIGISVGFPVKREDGDSKQVFQFTFGGF